MSTLIPNLYATDEGDYSTLAPYSTTGDSSGSSSSSGGSAAIWIVVIIILCLLVVATRCLVMKNRRGRRHRGNRKSSYNERLLDAESEPVQQPIVISQEPMQPMLVNSSGVPIVEDKQPTAGYEAAKVEDGNKEETNDNGTGNEDDTAVYQ